ncbi:MAG: hypothetical protein OCD00_05525 [Colwellia sp.]
MFKKLLSVLLLLSINACKPATINVQPKLNPQCLVSQSECTVTTPVGQFTVKFSVKPEHGKVLAEIPFYIVFDAKNNTVAINELSGYLEGVDMFMGKVPVFFTQDEENKYFIAETLLGSCSEDIMTWRLWLTVTTHSTQESLEVKFEKKAQQSQTFFIDFDSHKYL